MSYDYDPLNEILDRVRRIETRTTIIGRHLGADVGGGKPSWSANNDGSGRIDAPTANCSLAEMMKVIPKGWSKGGHVYANGDYLFSFTILPQ